jgi:hypothetical protein
MTPDEEREMRREILEMLAYIFLRDFEERHEIVRRGPMLKDGPQLATQAAKEWKNECFEAAIRANRRLSRGDKLEVQRFVKED